ncbi:aldehyde dehydrogenase [Shewanella halifaxensis HAW-EB4]|uniref:Aldehyde dehydrogenase n=1 Tax=Shewanella halifaxensis (strain HAW-EB4) TaxID=458817 RepID=B0TTT3_SHEHH|nr:coniferyl aldehyde dehydrogenase [Shewanella halifaxensis]ABZ76651.1 aldehyde dehydrogenase [Shewanella halifaxensis HAW-EB4]
MTTPVNSLAQLLTQQKQAHLVSPNPTASERKARIQQVIDLLVASHSALVTAMEEDFGGRSQGFSLMNDVLGSLGSLKHTRDNLEDWMAAENRQPFAPYDQLGAKAEVSFQAKGSVGIIGTWNAPLYTLLSPLACALGAGNRAILKPSELTPRTAQTIAELFAKFISPEIVTVVTGGAEIGADFAALPFDHIVFTGSTNIGRKVMSAAAKNLTPVTLELGGKSPAIISASANIDQACYRLAIAKGTNGGQICVSPDIIYLHEENLEQGLTTLKQVFSTLYPSISHNQDLVPMVNQAHFERVESYIEEAKAKGARVESSHDTLADPITRRAPLRIIVNPTNDCDIMQHEIFGLAVVIKTYLEIDTVINDINSRDNPLALYYFGQNSEEQVKVLSLTRSGGVTINDALMHAAMHDAPFGGTGGSGIGHYHGKEGFLEFSHMKTVLTMPDYDPRAEWGMLPPYHEGFKAVMESQITAD